MENGEAQKRRTIALTEPGNEAYHDLKLECNVSPLHFRGDLF